MPTLTKQDIVAKFRSDLKTKQIDVPALGGSITIRELSGTERDHLDTLRIMEKDKEKVLHENYIYAAACGIVNESGEQLFSYDEIKAQYKANSLAIRFIADNVQELSDATGGEGATVTKN